MREKDLEQIKSDLIEEKPYVRDHVQIDSGIIKKCNGSILKYEHLTVEFYAHTNEACFRDITEYLRKLNYFDSVDYTFSPVRNGSGCILATKRY